MDETSPPKRIQRERRRAKDFGAVFSPEGRDFPREKLQTEGESEERRDFRRFKTGFDLTEGILMKKTADSGKLEEDEGSFDGIGVVFAFCGREFTFWRGNLRDGD